MPFNKLMVAMLVSFFCLVPCVARATEIILKSGSKLEGTVIEQTDKYIKFDSGVGVVITYYMDEIDSIDGRKLDGHAPASLAVVSVGTRDQIDTLFIDSGLEYQLGNFAQNAIAGFDRLQNRSSKHLSLPQVHKIHKIMLDYWSTTSLAPIIKDYMATHLSNAAIHKSLAWFASPVGSSVTKFEEEASRPGFSSKLKEYIKQLNNQPPTSQRMDLLKRFVDASGEAGFAYKLYVAQMDLMVSNFEREDSVKYQKEAEKIKFGVELAKPQIEASVSQTAIISALYTYKDLSDDQLSQYVDFLVSPEGEEFIQVTQEGLLKAIKVAQQKISDYLIELIHIKDLSQE